MEDETNDWWQDLQDGITPPGAEVEEKPLITNPEQATKALFKFRPVREDIDELQRLLTLRADPNAEIPKGSISPLMNVSMFAPLSRVVAMVPFSPKMTRSIGIFVRRTTLLSSSA